MNIIYFIVGIVAATIILLFFFRRPFVVEHEQEIDAERETIWGHVIDLRKRHAWSPWINNEPDCKLEYSEDTTGNGSWNSWDGQYIGAGTITRTRVGTDFIEEQLQFTRPRFRPCRVRWQLAKLADRHYTLTWTMHGSVPLIMSFIVGRMKAQIKRDFELGLGYLNRLVNPQAEAPLLSFSYPVKASACHYVGIKHRCAIDDIGPWMEQTMPRLLELLREKGIETTGSALTIWNKRHFGGKEFTFTNALPICKPDAVKIKADAEAQGMFTDFYQGGENFVETLLEGDYRFLPTSWLVAFDHLKMRKLKFDWKKPPIEIYDNDPRSVKHSNETRTRILIGVRP